MYACLGVTCHLYFWQNDWGILRATAVGGGTDNAWESAHKVDSGEENSPAVSTWIQACNLSITSPLLKPTNYPGSPAVESHQLPSQVALSLNDFNRKSWSSEFNRKSSSPAVALAFTFLMMSSIPGLFETFLFLSLFFTLFFFFFWGHFSVCLCFYLLAKRLPQYAASAWLSNGCLECSVNLKSISSLSTPTHVRRNELLRRSSAAMSGWCEWMSAASESHLVFGSEFQLQKVWEAEGEESWIKTEIMLSCLNDWKQWFCVLHSNQVIATIMGFDHQSRMRNLSNFVCVNFCRLVLPHFCLCSSHWLRLIAHIRVPCWPFDKRRRSGRWYGSLQMCESSMVVGVMIVAASVGKSQKCTDPHTYQWEQWHSIQVLVFHFRSFYIEFLTDFRVQNLWKAVFWFVADTAQVKFSSVFNPTAHSQSSHCDWC